MAGLARKILDPKVKVAFLGAGNMALPMAQAAVRVLGLEGSVIAAGRKYNRKRFEAAGAGYTENVAQAARGAQVVFHCPKPQSHAQMIQEVGEFESDATHVSIMAGTPMPTLAERIGSEQIIRCMPNMPGAIGNGVTGVYSPDCIDENIKALVMAILKGMGHVERVSEEPELDIVTAAAGSGPGIIAKVRNELIQLEIEAQAKDIDATAITTEIMGHFYVGMSGAAKQLGLSETVAKRLVDFTVEGTEAYITFLRKRGEIASLDELAMRVASKKGTTEAAFNILAAINFPNEIRRVFIQRLRGDRIDMACIQQAGRLAVTAAHSRAVALREEQRVGSIKEGLVPSDAKGDGHYNTVTVAVDFQAQQTFIGPAQAFPPECS